MQLEELKTIWNKDNTSLINNENLLNMIHQPSTSPVAEMKRNLRFELYSVFVVYLLTAFLFLFQDDGRFLIVSGTYVLLLVLFYIYYRYKMKLLNNMQCLTCEVKSNMKKQLATLDKYLNFYHWSSTLIVPLLLLFFGWLGLQKKTDSHILSKYTPDEIVLPYLIFVAVLGVALFFANKSYIKSMYGKHVNRLKAVVNELEEQ
jgi:intracellular septation protein A